MIVPTIYEAINKVTTRRGDGLMRFEIENMFDASTEMVHVRKVVMRLMYNNHVPQTEIVKQFKTTRQIVNGLINAPEHIVERAMYIEAKEEIQEIYKRNFIKL